MKRARLQSAIVVSVFAIVAFFALAHQADAVNVSPSAYIAGTAQETFDSIIESLMYAILTVMSKVLWLAGTLFNVAVKESLNISNFVTQIGSVEVVWKTIRDFTSIFFIFVLLYTSIKHILGDSGNDTKKVIVNLIIAGLLINFSMFITKTIIDGSNVVAKGFYDAITVNQETKITSTNVTEAFAQNLRNTDGGISQIFMQSLRLSTIYDARGLSTNGDDKARLQANLGLNAGNIILVGVFGSVLMLIAAFVFFAGAFMFIIRIAILIMLIALSPVAFIGKVLPQTEQYSKKWWSTLIDQCTFAPVYLAMTYLGLKILTAPGFAENVYSRGQTFSAAITSGAAPKIFLNFALVIIFFLAALAVATMFGGDAAKYGMKAGEIGRKLVGGVSSFAGRNTIGRWAGRINENLEGGSGSIARIANSGLGRSIRESTLGAATTAKFGGESNFLDTQKLEKDIKSKSREIDKRKEVASAIKAGANAAAGSDAANKLELTVGKLSNKELEAIGDERYTSPAVAQNLTDSQLEYLMKSDTVKDKDKNAIIDARFKPIKEKADAVAAAAGTPAENAARGQLRDALKTFSEKDLKHLGFDRLKNAKSVVEELNAGKMSALIKSDTYTESQKAEMKKWKSAPLEDAIAKGDGSAIEAIIRGIKKPEDVAKLPIEILKDPKVAKYLKPSHLKEIEKEISDVSDIANNIKPGHPAWDYVIGEGKAVWGMGRTAGGGAGASPDDDAWL